jgi:ATP-dependent Clp protease ATP-binding subunit ClpC
VFERYTEPARRALFFARYELSELGGTAIETEHILLGLLREGNGLTTNLFARAEVHVDSVRREIQMRMPDGQRFPTSMELPFSQHAKRVLKSGASESDRLGHNYIGTEHLLLGILREPDTVAAKILVERELISSSFARRSCALLTWARPRCEHGTMRCTGRKIMNRRG